MEPSLGAEPKKKLRTFYRRLLTVGLLYLAFSILAGMVIADLSLKFPLRPLHHRQEFAALVQGSFQAELQDISIHASDGVTLKGWYVHPQHFNGNSVILLHGITDNREGVRGYARLFLEHGYAVLLPDARRHGESGGELATYGVKESEDIHRWVSWMVEHDPPPCVFGFGESYAQR
jgi:pimeloyl-ACP methyl ester carboxylesterase